MHRESPTLKRTTAILRWSDTKKNTHTHTARAKTEPSVGSKGRPVTIGTTFEYNPFLILLLVEIIIIKASCVSSERNDSTHTTVRTPAMNGLYAHTRILESCLCAGVVYTFSETLEPSELFTHTRTRCWRQFSVARHFWSFNKICIFFTLTVFFV